MEREPGAAGLNEIEADGRKWVKLLVVAARRCQKQEASCPAVARDSKRVLNSSETNLSRFILEILCKDHDFIPVVPALAKISTFSHCIGFHIITASPTGPKCIKAMRLRGWFPGLLAMCKRYPNTS